MAGQWQSLPNGSFRRFVPRGQLEGYGGGGSWEEIDKLQAVKLGMVNPSTLSDSERFGYGMKYGKLPSAPVSPASSGYGAAAGGATGSSSLTGDPLRDKAIAEMKAAMDAANAANEARYNEAKGIMDQRISGAQNYGAQQKKDTDQAFNSAWGGIQQQLAGRGLGSSSLTASGAMGNERERANAQSRLGEQISRYKNDLMADKATLIQSKQENAPDWGTYLNLLTQGGYGQTQNVGANLGMSSGGSRYSYSRSNDNGGSSNERARPWSPNYWMGKGLDQDAAVAAAGGAPMSVASGGGNLYGGYAPVQNVTGPGTGQTSTPAQRQALRKAQYVVPRYTSGTANKVWDAIGGLL